MATRKLIYAVEKNIRGGVTIYGENGVRRYFCKTVAKAVKAYKTQAVVEEIIIQHRSRKERHHGI